MSSYNPVRWVCQRSKNKCDGYFHQHGKDAKCPLYSRCKAPGGKDHQLEYFHQTRAGSSILTWEYDPNRTKAHNDRYVEICQAFGVLAQRRRETLQRHPETRERILRKQRERRREKALMDPPAPRRTIPPPPCGGDHRNCPYGGDCHYPSWEDDWIRDAGKRVWERVKSDPELHEHRKETHRAWYHGLKNDPERWAEEQKKRAAARQRYKAAVSADPARAAAAKARQAAYNRQAAAKRKADPVQAAYWREYTRLYSQKRRAKVKFIKSGGSPEEFEKQWKVRTMDHGEE